ncbi:hypothetical protein LH991_08975 [Schleiferilactobacillus harbinensis]|jgi:cell wall-associated NlpC family hydrolase|uniref:NlpC/P60 domain-containing protein n=1 Tax=Schleiferilactobacillus harbinensis DSM 16991 TaxID=1122147 RepID=A0A0R1X6R3_9LACO|nr:peptidoglycan amidohydrolase family protein [Schleiferilactobacillus harbinensis]KRM25903.1 hypothetical protein FC91_GL000379 [Schleiferilactobacillus harbinensis DSM 16991]MBO3091107.1 hypothetical protein [Schleiferilactobacillus harbinensis]QFR64096.1 hypothetical protein LH991_08975 [Schleiferilactobacillus harbinensis]GEK07340.1 hypothetical protein LHA01_25790 [Schleiferilactobacillus harbinensis]
MTVNMDRALAFMEALQANHVTYSMTGSRTGADGTADCSGAVYTALCAGGAPVADTVLDTETMHGWLLTSGFVLLAENMRWPAQRGDVFIWGEHGKSAGAGGHTGIFITDHDIIHCNYSHNGVSVNNYGQYWNTANRPYYYAYRYSGS